MTDLSLRTGSSGAVDVQRRRVGGREVVVAEIGFSAKLGALSLDDGETLAYAVETALESRVPFIGYMASTGALVGDGIQASHGWGLAARQLVRASGVIPVLFAVCGPAVSGTALLLGMADLVVFTEDAYAFVSGPHMVRQFTGVSVGAESLGGSACHARHSGLAVTVTADREAATETLAELLTFLPSNCDELPTRWPCDDPADRPTPEAASILPTSASASYDIREVIATFVDDGEIVEVRGGWATNLVTALASIDGRAVGIVANQPLSIAGTLDIPASQKGARFVAFCDAFNIPIITLVDTPGFYPGKDLEWRGMIRHGAQMAFAYARATVPRISLTLRKSYGGAYIVMDSKHMGNDLALAWPTAEIAVMGAKGAIQILHKGLDDDARVDLEAAYEERLLNPYVAAERGSIDAVIEPADTRRELAAALAALESKREHLQPRAHDNTPL